MKIEFESNDFCPDNCPFCEAERYSAHWSEELFNVNTCKHRHLCRYVAELSQIKQGDERKIMVKFTVPGEPRGKGRPRFSKQSGYVRAYTDDKTASYENLVKIEYQNASNGKMFTSDEPVGIDISAFYGIPKSVSKKKREQMLDGRLLPMKKPDVDNIVKTVLDGLNGVAYVDDKQVVEVSIFKYYDENPRVVVTVYRAGT